MGSAFQLKRKENSNGYLHCSTSKLQKSTIRTEAVFQKIWLSTKIRQIMLILNLRQSLHFVAFFCWILSGESLSSPSPFFVFRPTLDGPNEEEWFKYQLLQKLLLSYWLWVYHARAPRDACACRATVCFDFSVIIFLDFLLCLTRSNGS